MACLIILGLVVTGGLLLARLSFLNAAFVLLALGGAGLGVALHPRPVRLIGIERAATSPIGGSVVGCSVGPVALGGLLWGVGVSGTAAAFMAIVRVQLWRQGHSGQQDGDGAGSRSAADALLPEPVVGRRPLDVPASSNEQLCSAWRGTCTELQRVRSGAALERIVDERRFYLDQIEARDPRGLALWISAGARADGNPLPRLSVDSDRPAS